ncbi:N-acetyltransferase 8-like [Lethenteron reissneri]|uniref:N-acetyltransferase 8-like n=1 Tax=Lethenteron reissneri TaxID=7753 RepID=UPI002AB67AF9|nr:N-acetyltransferase 8-like [Lethenteron reissneri]XP_061418046.1 N-acetyltransferase 8-like [Lethenteron reissneri]XP_061418047.1 N-acetyltransferase 8-like [Lethenteron reissneri]XP_061418048.1 N-acetyltransferase 8-like [Lethenteron reissneri]XP_061418049.1 N-acetyltransferase 8-like [Lethenteron reissneri]XP_061418051.1 N-acetyltransferase 8-like [Lethenteron reissneri]
MEASHTTKRAKRASALQKQTGALSFHIRPYEDKDFHRVRELFCQGMMGLARPLFYSTVSRPSNLLIMVATLALIYICTSSLLAAIGGVMSVLLALYYCCWFAYSSYVTAMLNSQMANIREHFVERPGSCFLVAETTCCDETTGRGGGGDVVGTLALVSSTQDPGACEMFRMVVDDRYSRRGIASCLVDAVLQRAREHGYRLCQLKTTMVQRPAIALYKKKGFVITKEALYTNGHSFFMLLIKLIIYEMEYVF